MDVALIFLVPFPRDVLELNSLMKNGVSNARVCCTIAQLRGLRTKKLIIFPPPSHWSLYDEELWRETVTVALTRLDKDGNATWL